MDDSGLIIFVSGFGTGSSGASSGNNSQTSGLGDLANQTFINDMQFQKGVFGWDEQESIIRQIREFSQANPDAPIYLVGHSYGSDSAIEVAAQLKDENIWLDKLVTIDSVGFNDDRIPDNVLDALNLYSTSGDGINGEYPIHGADNVGIDGTSHTAIDTDEKTWQAISEFFAVGVSSDFPELDDSIDSDDAFHELPENTNDEATNWMPMQTEDSMDDGLQEDVDLSDFGMAAFADVDIDPFSADEMNLGWEGSDSGAFDSFQDSNDAN